VEQCHQRRYLTLPKGPDEATRTVLAAAGCTDLVGIELKQWRLQHPTWHSQNAKGLCVVSILESAWPPRSCTPRAPGTVIFNPKVNYQNRADNDILQVHQTKDRPPATTFGRYADKHAFINDTQAPRSCPICPCAHCSRIVLLNDFFPSTFQGNDPSDYPVCRGHH